MHQLRNPLLLIGAIIIFQLLVLNRSFEFWYGVLFLVIAAYVQNASYGLQSRAGTRSSNAYHLVTSIVSSLVFFATFQYLLRNNMPFELLPAYIFATMIGSLHGNKISARIEKIISAGVEAPKNQTQLMRFWPSIIALVIILLAQILFIPSSVGKWILVSLAVSGILAGSSFSLLRLARSSDNYWFHGCVALLNFIISLWVLAIFVQYKMDWILFWPNMTGAVIGNIIGANLARTIFEKLKAHFDAHVISNKNIEWPSPQIAVCSLGLVAHIFFFGFEDWVPLAFLLSLALLQQVSFTVISRARQRNSELYLLWASVFSNGLWYFTNQQLAYGNITLEEAAPYLVGSTVGSLTGQQVAMHVEKRVDARMDMATV